MGMPEAEFFDTTPVHFMRRRKAFLQNRNGMEEARFISFFVMKAAGAKIRRLTQIAKFPWDVFVPSVQLEAWDSPEMVKFSEDADKALAILNPEAYAKYMAGKKEREEAPPAPPMRGGDVDALGITTKTQPEANIPPNGGAWGGQIEAELDF